MQKNNTICFVYTIYTSRTDDRWRVLQFADIYIYNISLGKEKDDFFGLLGGKTPYSTKMIKNESDPRLPRLFYCSKDNEFFKGIGIIFVNIFDYHFRFS